jgi:hypothetical protein
VKHHDAHHIEIAELEFYRNLHGNAVKGWSEERDRVRELEREVARLHDGNVELAATNQRWLDVYNRQNLAVARAYGERDVCIEMAREYHDAEKMITVTGNPVDGFKFYGPFIDVEDAQAQGEVGDADWWIADLTDPDVAVGGNG